MATIGVCDDDRVIREIARRPLEKRGHRVLLYIDGQDCLEAILRPGAEVPDLLITDVRMPRLDGIALCAKLRRFLSKSALPIVMVSSVDTEEDILKGFEAGANDYMVKPYRTEMLLAKIQVLLNEKRFFEDLGRGAAPAPESPEPRGDLPPDQEDDSASFAFDKYEVVSVIGRGGMGVVYRALQRDTNRLVALKILSPRLGEDRVALARFLREVALLSEVRSEHIVSVVDSGLDRGRWFLAMELVEGKSAKEMLEDGPFDPYEAVFIARQVAMALVEVHRRGLVHRDVKPSNILVDAEGNTKLVDFGLVKEVGMRDVTRDDVALGTMHYLPPEVLDGYEADIRSDIYALGLSLYELVTGGRLYAATSMSGMLEALFNSPEPDVEALHPELPPPVAWLIQRMVAREPLERFQGPEDLLAAIDETLEQW